MGSPDHGGRLGKGRYVEHVTQTTHAVLESPGATTPAVRWSAFHQRWDELPDVVRDYARKVAEHAYQVSDEDVIALTRAGWTEDAIFEVTAAAALGAAILRLERGLIVVHEGAS